MRIHHGMSQLEPGEIVGQTRQHVLMYRQKKVPHVFQRYLQSLCLFRDDGVREYISLRSLGYALDDFSEVGRSMLIGKAPIEKVLHAQQIGSGNEIVQKLSS